MEEERRLWKNLKQIVSGESPESKEEVQEAVEYVVEECGSQGYLEENEVRMIKNVLQYSGKNARDIMTHRKDIVAVDVMNVMTEIRKAWGLSYPEERESL